MKPVNICLMMIVKNEQNTLPTLIESVKPFISQWVIIDTGSNDDTKKVVQVALKDLPGTLHEKVWVDFGHNRSELISMIPASADFALLLDADHVLEAASVDEVFLEIIAATHVNAFMVRVDEFDLSYRMPYLVRRGPKYRYEGATHEYLTAVGGLNSAELNSLRIIHLGNGGSKQDKFERDLKALQGDIKLGRNLVRNHFYLGQTFEFLNRSDDARMHYSWVANNSDWDEERYVSRLRIARILEKDGQLQEALDQFWSAIDECPDRVEAVFGAVKILEQQKHFAVALKLVEAVKQPDPKRILFVENWILDWGLQLELGVIFWNLGNLDKARWHFNEVLNVPNLTQETIDLVNRNLSFC